MNIQLHSKESLRISTNQNNNFIDVMGEQDEAALAVCIYPRFHYIEMREKEGHIKIFLFKNKGVKKYIDLGWWSDAEVVFAKNEVIKP